MNNTQALFNANVANLTALWRSVSEPIGGYFPGPTFDYCAIANSDWPNRFWFHEPIDETGLALVMSLAKESPIKLTLSTWTTDDSTLLMPIGLPIRGRQFGMFTKPNRVYESGESLRLVRVTTADEAILWTGLFTQSFGYQIAPFLVRPESNETHWMLVYEGQTPVGTALIHRQANTAVLGIHSMGIVPAHRGKGIAKNLMLQILQQATDDQVEYVTLQASEMGQKLYLSLGFEQQFIMTNYAL